MSTQAQAKNPPLPTPQATTQEPAQKAIFNRVPDEPVAASIRENPIYDDEPAKKQETSQYGISKQKREEWHSLSSWIDDFSRLFANLENTNLHTIPSIRFVEALNLYEMALEQVFDRVCRLADSLFEREKHALLKPADTNNATALMRAIIATVQSTQRLQNAMDTVNHTRHRNLLPALSIESKMPMLRRVNLELRSRYEHLAALRNSLLK